MIKIPRLPALAPGIALQFAFAVAGETAIKPEVNPPGDITDSQAFVVYKAPEGFSLKVPEGWARQVSAGQVTFNDKYNTITVRLLEQPNTTTARIKADLIPQIASGGHAAKPGKVHVLKIKGVEAVQAEYTVNPEPNTVTGKQIRLEAARTFYLAGDKVLELDLTAPQGADNVDQWKLIANSVRLK